MMKKKLVSFGIIVIVMSLLAACNAAGSYDRKGKKCFAHGEYEDAAEYFTKAISENPNRADYYIDYGMTLIALKQYDKAITEFDRAYQDKDAGVIIQKKNKKILRGKGIALYCKKEYKEAIRQFDQALKIGVSSDLDKDILYYKASTFLAMGSCEDAIGVYSSMLSMDKKDITALMNRAYCYRILGKYAKSIADYDKAIAIDPKGYDFYFGKYFVLMDQKNKAGAKKVLKQAAAIQDSSEEGRYDQAKLHFYQGEYDAALSEFRGKDLRKFAGTFFFVGEIYRMKKDYKSAVYYYESYIKKDEELTPEVYNQLGSCQIKLGAFKSAIKNLKKGIQMNSAGSMRVLLKNEIVAYEGVGRYDVALKKLEKYLENYPEDEEARKEEVFLKSRVQAPDGNSTDTEGGHLEQ
jgi:tetratricopeptide (TPR) repeat protein